MSGIRYFDDLPRYAMTALQTAWDKVSVNQFGNKFVFTSFCKDMDAVGIDRPSLPAMTAWINAVKEGRIERPKRSDAGAAKPAAAVEPEASLIVCDQADIAETDVAAVEQAERAVTADDAEVLRLPITVPQGLVADDAGASPAAKGQLERAAPSDFHVLSPADFRSSVAVEETPEIVLQSLTARMVDEEEAKLRLYVRDQARKIVAGRLRAMLEQLGALDA